MNAWFAVKACFVPRRGHALWGSFANFRCTAEKLARADTSTLDYAVLVGTGWHTPPGEGFSQCRSLCQRRGSVRTVEWTLEWRLEGLWRLASLGVGRVADQFLEGRFERL